MTALLGGNIRAGLAGFEGMLFGCLRMDSRLPNVDLVSKTKVMIVSGPEIKEGLERHLGVSKRDVGGRKCRL